MRYVLIVLWTLLLSATSALAQVSIGIGLPNVSIGINIPLYPDLVPVPGYPVYYAPRLNSNYFFYDGMYWVYQGDNWYASSWYNGPWSLVDPEFVPLFVLRIPVRYYRNPPSYFRGWRADAPPLWGQHWGREWEQRRSGWDRWNRSAAPARAPLPTYQRQYSGNRYPRAVEQQQTLQSQKYRYQPRDAVVRQHYQERAAQAPAAVPRAQQAAPQERSQRPQDIQRATPPQLQQGGAAAPRSQPPQRGREEVQRPAPAQSAPQQRGPAVQEQRQQQPPQGAVQEQRRLPPQGAVQEQRQPPQQGAAPREEQAPRSQGRGNEPQGKSAPQEQRQGQGQEERPRGEERGQERNR